jgi:hypothetical protein
MKIHSKTELATFFVECLIARMLKEWINIVILCLLWISALFPHSSDFMDGFFIGADVVVTLVFFLSWATLAYSRMQEKQWRVDVYENIRTGQKYSLTLPPSLPSNKYAFASQIKGQA